MTNKQRLYAWLGAAGLFLIIAVACVSFIFAPVVDVTEYPDGTVQTFAPSALSFSGMGDRAESWRKYPDYTIGLGVACGLSFTGAVCCFFFMEKERRTVNA